MANHDDFSAAHDLRTDILDARVSFQSQRFRTPLVISSGSITHVTEADAEVRILLGGVEAVGHGTIYLSDLWAWPHPTLSHEYRDKAMRALCQQIAEDIRKLSGTDSCHPLELGLRLNTAIHLLVLPDAMPALVRSVCLSPFDAALHDAVGKALRVSSFSLYQHDCPIPSADYLFPDCGAVRAIRETMRPPKSALTAWLVVGTTEPLDTLSEWVQTRGYHAFKLKLSGKDTDLDVARTAAVFHAARAAGVAAPRLCVDSNCANPDADSVEEYLLRLRATDGATFGALEYVEQPTARDIAQFAFDWHSVSSFKPVVLDEGLTSLNSLVLSHEQGWRGIALKTCKGQSFSLVAAAWAHTHGQLLVLQDLTNPGRAAIHAFLMAAHLHPFNGIELNAVQYTPDANRDWLPRLQPLMAPTDGCHRLVGEIPSGLGSDL